MKITVPNKKTLTAPTVHLNGTTGSTLFGELHDALTAVNVAIEKVCDACPHGRDYYVEGPGAYEAARKQFNERLDALKEIAVELEALCDEVDRQMEVRKR